MRNEQIKQEKNRQALFALHKQCKYTFDYTMSVCVLQLQLQLQHLLPSHVNRVN